eukprot:191693-Amphidinium_carterae.2
MGKYASGALVAAPYRLVQVDGMVEALGRLAEVVETGGRRAEVAVIGGKLRRKGATGRHLAC